MCLIDISRTQIYFVVVSSVFNSDQTIHAKYDIKGSTVGRVVSEEKCKMGSVQKDLNLIQSGRVLRLGPGLVDAFLDTLSNDCLFLQSLRIMDYSLLVGQPIRHSMLYHSSLYCLLGYASMVVINFVIVILNPVSRSASTK